MPKGIDALRGVQGRAITAARGRSLGALSHVERALKEFMIYIYQAVLSKSVLFACTFVFVAFKNLFSTLL